jgi:hypothetical protein
VTRLLHPCPVRSFGVRHDRFVSHAEILIAHVRLCGPPARQLPRFVAAVARSLPPPSIRVVTSGITHLDMMPTTSVAEIYLQARPGQNQSAAVNAARRENHPGQRRRQRG